MTAIGKDPIMMQRKPKTTTDTQPTRPTIMDDSTAFSLAALAEAEMRRTRAAPPRPDRDSSGLIVLEDLRGHRARPSYQLVDPVCAAPVPRGMIDRRWAQAGVLAVGMAASAVVGAIAIDVQAPAPTMAIEHKARPAATLALHHAEPTLAAAQAILRSEHRAKIALEVASAEGEDTPEADAALEEPPARATPAPARARATPATPARARTTPSPAPASTPPASSTPSLSADCILDPSRCGPERLTSAQIRTGLQQVESAAKTCAAAHGAAAGTRVPVRLSIEGRTGQVRQATPQAPHQNALGRCVANELSRATFPTFTQSSMGVIYTVTL